MNQTINIELSTSSIDAAIAELSVIEQTIESKTVMLNSRLAMLAKDIAEERFGTTLYRGDNDVQIYAEPTENGWQIIAKGRAVFFIEFGAGVHYNPTEPYPEPRPEGIVGIGEYGQGKGKRQTWYFYDTNGEKVVTHGNPASMPMFFAKEAVIARLNEIAQEVFGT